MIDKFKRYESIPNDNSDRTINFYKENGYANGDWYATEKVHGTNFSFLSDGVTVTHAQRSGVIEGNFMNHLEFVHKMDSKILKLAQQFTFPIQVVCEYYGKGIINKNAIQYRNDDEKDFIAYDIMNLETGLFLDFNEVFSLFDLYEIPRVFIIATGTFDELLQLEVTYKSFLAMENGVTTNAEGIVLKPYVDTRVADTNERVILKRVSPAFAENQGKAAVKAVTNLSSEIIELVQAKNNDTRLGKVAGKFGILPTEKSKMGTLVIEYTKDICDEIQSETGTSVDSNLVKKELVSHIKTYFE